MGVPRVSGAQRAGPGTILQASNRAASPPHGACGGFSSVYFILLYFPIALSAPLPFPSLI